jgi:hypothetical protein
MVLEMVIVAIDVGVVAYFLCRRKSGRKKPAMDFVVTAPESRKILHQPPQESDDEDTREDRFREAADPFPAEATLRIAYVDSNGRQTERVVDVKQFDETLCGGMIIGFCHLRQATRTFAIDRIRRCIVEGTGEVVGDVRKFLWNLHENGVPSTSDQPVEEDFSFLRARLSAAKTVGGLSEKEAEKIAEACHDLTGGQRIEGGTNREKA